MQLLALPDDLNNYIKDESHCDILLMHLIKKHHGIKSVMALLEEKSKEPLTCLKSIKEKLEVCSYVEHAGCDKTWLKYLVHT